MSTTSALHGAATTLFSNLFITLPLPKGGPALSEQTFIVTGSNTGLGLEAVRHLSSLGAASIIMAVRNEEKGREARKNVLESTGRPQSSIEVWHLDMASYTSVKKFATRASSLPRIDGVLANAGIWTKNFTLAEGTEQVLTVNVISTVLLYLLLAPKMRESFRKTGNMCHYAVPNSALHYMAPVAELKSQTPGLLDRLSDPKQADMAGRYHLSKLLVLYAVRELAKRDQASGKKELVINTPNPSFCKSNLVRGAEGNASFRFSEKLFARTTEEGSRAILCGLFAGEESNGQYLTNCHVQTPSCETTGKWGQKTQSFFFDELLAKLESVEPGISANI